MAGSFGGSDDDYVSGINVTPLVDVVLVLLVIFLMTAPVLYQSAIKVQLPQVKKGDANNDKTPLNFAISKEGQIYWNKDKIDFSEIVAKVSDYVKKEKDPTQLVAMISADQAAQHGTVVKLMDHLRQAGLSRFGLNVESQPQ
ncbi:MAG: biopolymer transporter ExbD [Bdellovibrionales bacterium]|nr:biopolymer transporter ExbD [Bdellovibrionales bacterium]